MIPFGELLGKPTFRAPTEYNPDLTLRDWWPNFIMDPSALEWRFKEFDTPKGTRQEIQFVHCPTILMMVPGEPRPQLLISWSSDKNIYGHAAYMMLRFLEWYSGMVKPELELIVLGSAYQALIPLKEVANIEVTEVYAKGTLNGRPRKYMESVKLKIKD